MIVLINGPFGIGKTTTAEALVRHWRRSFLFDPEIVGKCLRYLLGPFAETPDFQDLPLWRTQTISLAGSIHDEIDHNLVMPMCLWRREYFDEIVGGLRDAGYRVEAFRLTASRETVRQRILTRPESEATRAWCLEHLDAALAAANDPAFGNEISTEQRSSDEIARDILRALAVDVSADIRILSTRAFVATLTPSDGRGRGRREARRK